jgi:hypothetical protein
MNSTALHSVFMAQRKHAFGSTRALYLPCNVNIRWCNVGRAKFVAKVVIWFSSSPSQVLARGTGTRGATGAFTSASSLMNCSYVRIYRPRGLFPTPGRQHKCKAALQAEQAASLLVVSAARACAFASPLLFDKSHSVIMSASKPEASATQADATAAMSQAHHLTLYTFPLAFNPAKYAADVSNWVHKLPLSCQVHVCPCQRHR